MDGFQFDCGLDPITIRFDAGKDFDKCDGKTISGSVFPYHRF